MYLVIQPPNCVRYSGARFTKVLTGSFQVKNSEEKTVIEEFGESQPRYPLIRSHLLLPGGDLAERCDLKVFGFPLFFELTNLVCFISVRFFDVS